MKDIMKAVRKALLARARKYEAEADNYARQRNSLLGIRSSNAVSCLAKCLEAQTRADEARLSIEVVRRALKSTEIKQE